MMAPQEKISFSRVLIIGGACIALLIGSGFATGQEIMQYFVAYGYAGVASILLMFVLFCLRRPKLCDGRLRTEIQ